LRGDPGRARLRLTSHPFQHTTGLIVPTVRPGGHKVVRQRLGHRSIGTTLRLPAGTETAAVLGHDDASTPERRREAAAAPEPVSSPWLGPSPALACRRGRIIAHLAARPLRLRNFVALELGRHLVRAGQGWRIVIQSAETKTGRPLELPFPEVLVPMLERYLTVHRPPCPIVCNAHWSSWR
jgi:hypothetical protein